MMDAGSQDRSLVRFIGKSERVEDQGGLGDDVLFTEPPACCLAIN